MFIEQITLSNWLSYPDKWEKDGQLVTPCLQFDQEPIYLIFGKNGSGKSSIMEGILFALFGDYSRASERQDIRNDSAIRIGEKSATVELIFKINGQRHKVQRVLNERTSNAAYFSWDTGKQVWISGPSQVKAVNSKIISLLGMEQDLFCGTVILEQGKTGRFMELKSSEQVDHVMNLLGLDIYNVYYEKAKELANQRKRKAGEIEKDLKSLSDASAEKVQNAESEVERLQKVLDQIEDDIRDLGQLYTKVQIVEGLRTELNKLAKKITEFETRLTHKVKIEIAAQIIQDWVQIETHLREIRQALKQYSEHQDRVKDFQTELAGKQKELSNGQKTLDNNLKPDYEQAKDTLKKAKDLLEAIHKQYAEAQKERDLIEAELNLDHRENEIQAQQLEREQQLKGLPQVEADYHLWAELNRVVPTLKAIVSDFGESSEIIASVAKSEGLLQEELDSLEQRRVQLAQLVAEQKILVTKLETAQKTEGRIHDELKTNQALLAKREEAHGKVECPTCGTSLQGKELDRFHQELVKLQEEIESGQQALTREQKITLELNQRLETLDKQSRQEEKAIEREDSRLTNEQINLKKRKSEAESKEQTAIKRSAELKDSLNYSTEIITDPIRECLNLAQQRLQSIGNIQEIYRQLNQVQADVNAAQAELEYIQSNRQYPAGTYNEAQLSDADNTVEELDAVVKQNKGDLEIAEEKERKIYEQLTTTEQDLRLLHARIQEVAERLLPKEQEHLAESEGYKQEVFNRFEELLSKLDWSTQQLEILRQAASGDQQAEQKIRVWVEEHRPLAAQFPELKKAEKEIGDLRSKQTTLEEQIKAFPNEVQQAQSKVIEKELQTKKKEKVDRQTEHKQWQQNVWEEAKRFKQKQVLEKDYEHLIIEEKDFRDLATLLEPPGRSSTGGPLLREIMRGAVLQVAKTASDILEEWNQSTEIMIPQNSLEFKIIDRASGNSERHYQLFSGGEKFMVALAMALAIGEVASDTGHTDCLFIDEGFGLLDADNRAVVAQEIVHNLVGSGRRKQVIVITHMEDLQDAFPTRHHLINDGSITRLSLRDTYAST